MSGTLRRSRKESLLGLPKVVRNGTEPASAIGSLLISLRLQFKQTRVLPILRKQALVIALLQDLTVVNNNDAVRCAYR